MLNITENKLQPTDSEFEALVSLFNAIRIAQGWSIMPPEEVYPIVLGWLGILKKSGIECAEYQKLFDKAIEFRTAEIRDKKRPTPFSIELLLAMKPSVSPIPYAPAAPRDRNAEMEARGFTKMNVVKGNH
jgi:hypothetical protein